MPKLIRWNTPFTDHRWPSVVLAIEQNQNSQANSGLRAIVAPHGIDKYPKYLVNFGEVIAFTCMEEAFCPQRDFNVATIDEGDLCAYQYIDSPWLKAYEEGRHFIANGSLGEFFHYVIFGGDNNVEVITANIAEIRKIEQSEILLIAYEI